MKKALIFLFVIFTAPALFIRCDNFYLEMLPQDSLVRQNCKWCDKGWIFATTTEKNCSKINAILEKADVMGDLSVEGFHQTGLAVRSILSAYDDEDKEGDLIYALQRQLLRNSQAKKSQG